MRSKTDEQMNFFMHDFYVTRNSLNKTREGLQIPTRRYINVHNLGSCLMPMLNLRRSFEPMGLQIAMKMDSLLTAKNEK
jgi:hypothetical protein